MCTQFALGCTIAEQKSKEFGAGLISPTALLHNFLLRETVIISLYFYKEILLI
jgi:hypothetical protein